MNLNLSLYLDQYLKQFPAIAAAKELLDAYNKENPQDLVELGSEEYYEQLLSSKYPYIYQLINVILVKPSMSWSEWYYVASNCYLFKGLTMSLQYLFGYLNVSARIKYSYEDMSLFMTIYSYTANNTTQFNSLVRELTAELLYYYGDPTISIINSFVNIIIEDETEALIKISNRYNYIYSGFKVTECNDITTITSSKSVDAVKGVTAFNPVNYVIPFPDDS